MADIQNLRISVHASDVAAKLVDQCCFPDALSATKFAMAYAIKFYFEDINTPEKINELDSTYTADGNNYNVGSVDKDGFIVRLFKLLYPGCETPFKYIRVVMCYGLMKMEDLIESNDLIPLSKNT